MRLITLRVEEKGRLDQHLLKELRRLGIPELSRAALKGFFVGGKILIRGRVASPSLLLSEGEWEVSISDWDQLRAAESPLARVAGALRLPVVYEDENLLVLHKSSGVPSVPLNSEETETAVGAALAYDPSLAGVGRGGLEPAILHRLDTGTSGLLVFARNSEEFERLSSLWRERGVRKFYRALVSSSVELQEINLELGHDAGSSRKMIVVGRGEIRGKALPSRTRVVGAHAVDAGFDLQIEIETGVMHQIRVSLASVGAPILGDSVYRGAPSSRLWLHAWRLTIPLKSGTLLELETSMPEGWPSPS